MQLKPWTEIATPHEDVLKGTFKQAEFAADLSLVKEGTAPKEYQDPISFFERTYITEGMHLLLDSVVKRLNGGSGDPVIQLQTAFGGGKTHTETAVYHLGKGEQPPSQLRGIPRILDAAGVTEIPKASIAVVDGNRMSPSQPKNRGNVEIRTLWGEIAWQVGGEDGFALLADSDRDGTSPGKEVLVQLFEKYSPCLILMDEMVAYLRQFQEGKGYPGGTFESNMSFVQALTEAVASTKDCMLLVALPESNTEMGGVRGQQALTSLEKYFGRIQALWKPVATGEAFEIVRRRLFNEITDQKAVEEVCRAFAQYYREAADDFPGETQEGTYVQRLTASYPIHPEIFDRLYLDWSSMEKFQRTRGVLQLLATVTYRLWKDGTSDPMIMPASLPLYDNNVKNQAMYYLPPGWDPVLDKDIDGEQALSVNIDTQNPLLGKHQAARRTARTIFLGSAPGARRQGARGIDHKHVNLGVAYPGISTSVVKDALKHLSDKLFYLNVDQERYWFDVTPNLRREMEERKQRFDEREDVLPEVKKRLEKLLKKGSFGGVHVFTPAADIPDDSQIRLCVLSPDKPHSKTSELGKDTASEILKTRGTGPRLHQNRLIFLAADYDTVPRLKDQARTYLAWKSIVEDVNQTRLVLDNLQAKQAEQNSESASSTLNRTITECFQWILSPIQHPTKQGGLSKLDWEDLRINTGATNMTEEIENKLTHEELLLKVWSPIHLDNMLKQWFWKQGLKDINTLELWEKMCNYLYLPRLLDSSILQATIVNGVASGEYFGYADGKEGDEYRGLKFKEPCNVVLDKSSVIIELETAKACKQAQQEPVPDPQGGGTDIPGHKQPQEGGGTPGQTSPGGKPGEIPGPDQPQATAKKRFYGTVELDPHTGRMDFDTIHKEIVSQLTARPGANVKLRLDIEAEIPEGFDEHTQRAVRENCGTLNFSSAEFDEE
ncbi:MAG: DUF499 domain-containing protein [Desulfohalobiaceae bacterium]|nr:DUF499 domain-containing protein [Desulfohalobiaceae bacterium]